MSEILDYEEAIRPFLSEKRYHHSLCVAEATEELARQYGADEEKAWIAGILHDILKETPGEEQLRMLDGFGIALTDLERSAPKLWHAITGAAYLEHTLHIQDREILDAVRYHTTGRADMTLLEKILFVADYTSADRQFDGVDRLRSLAREGLDQAVLLGSAFTIEDLAHMHKAIHPDTLAAYNWYVLQGEDTRKENQGYGSLGPAEREKTGTPEK